MDQIVYADTWGEIIDRKAAGFVEVRWFDSTAAMQAGEFNTWLQQIATAVEQTGRTAVLIDATSFTMTARWDDGWRDANIIPRYNAAGVRKFAFHMPAGMPAIGSPPAAEGPAQFPTGYFGARNDAVDWLSK